MSGPGTLVLGIGNLLLGDEGIGVHVVRALESDPRPAGVTVLDGGTGGFHLLGPLRDHPRVVIIDAAADGQPPGTVSVLEPRYPSDFPRVLTAHDVGLRDLIESAALLGPLPWMRLVTISIEPRPEMDLSLSPPVAGAIPVAVARVREILGDAARAGTSSGA